MHHSSKDQCREANHHLHWVPHIPATQPQHPQAKEMLTFIAPAQCNQHADFGQGCPLHAMRQPWPGCTDRPRFKPLTAFNTSSPSSDKESPTDYNASVEDSPLMMDPNLNCPEVKSPTAWMTATADSPCHPEVESPMDRACGDDQLPSSSRGRVTNEKTSAEPQEKSPTSVNQRAFPRS